MKIILASSSPRRKEILEKHEIFPIVIPSEADETIPRDIEDLGIEEIVKYLAHLKAFSVYNEKVEICDEMLERSKLVNGGDNDPNEKILILGADTVVYKDRIIGKPKDEEDAFSILSSLRDASHYVYTGVSLIDYKNGEEIVFCDATKVYFNDYSDEEILRFIREEPPYDKSGSYAIQSSWSKNVNRIEGDIDNVIGLPWKKLEKKLKEF